jgi:RNA polymerase sigma-70 factor (ECF subfamily)
VWFQGDTDRAARFLLEQAETAELGDESLLELLLVHACLTGDPEALRRLDALLHLEVQGVFPRFQNGPLSFDEAEQLVREKLLIGSERVGPRLVEFRARGSLRGWLKVVALRTLVDATRSRSWRQSCRQVSDAALAGIPALAQDPAIRYLRQSYKKQTQAAVAAALQELTVRERCLLRYVHGHNLSLTQLADIYRVHRTTVGRWLEEAYDKLRRTTAAELTHRLPQLPAQDVESLLRALMTEMTSGFGQLLVESTV